MFTLTIAKTQKDPWNRWNSIRHSLNFFCAPRATAPRRGVPSRAGRIIWNLLKNFNLGVRERIYFFAKGARRRNLQFLPDCLKSIAFWYFFEDALWFFSLCLRQFLTLFFAVFGSDLGNKNFSFLKIIGFCYCFVYFQNFSSPYCFGFLRLLGPAVVHPLASSLSNNCDFEILMLVVLFMEVSSAWTNRMNWGHLRLGTRTRTAGSKRPRNAHSKRSKEKWLTHKNAPWEARTPDLEVNSLPL